MQTELPAHPPEPKRPAPQPELRTGDLLLRAFNTDGDPAVVQRILQCREIAANTRTIDHPYPEGAALKWISTLQETWESGAGSVFAICHADNRQVPIGAIGLLIDASNENAELGYWIDESWWGRGVCSRAARCLIEFGFSALGLNRIHAHHLERNPASGRVMEKAGMQYEGRLRKHVKKWGVFQDTIHYAILAEDRA
jgi:RimJ/RimL family protein N-acetyltransferase